MRVQGLGFRVQDLSLGFRVLRKYQCYCPFKVAVGYSTSTNYIMICFFKGAMGHSKVTKGIVPLKGLWGTKKYHRYGPFEGVVLY